MANKQLTAKVRLNTKDAEKSLDRLAKKINSVQKAVNRTASNEQQVTSAINKSVAATQKLNEKTNKVATANNKAANSANKLRNAFRSSNTEAGALLKTVKSLASTYLGIMGARAVIDASDTITSTENRLNNIEGGNPTLTQESMDKTYAAAQRSRSGYADMLDNVGKTMTLAGDSFQGNIDNAIRFQEIMAKAYTIGGASAAEQSSSMYQLVQALGSGILQGDELRSVREGAPIAYKEIEKFAQGVFKTEDSLKDLASQGVITSDIIVAAIMNAEDEINKSFNNTKMTFGQAWEGIGNMAMQAFRPVLQMLNDALNSKVGQAIVKGIGSSFVFLANTILWVGKIFGAFFTWCYDNWYWLQWVVAGVISAILVYFGIMAAQAIWAGIQAFLAFLTGVAPLYWWIILIGAVVAGIVWLANTTMSGCQFMITALLGVAIVILLIGLIVGSTVALIVGVVILAIAGLLALMSYCGEETMGIIYTVGAFIYNLVVGVINGILQLIWAMIEPIISVVEFILNACNGGFNDFGGAVANLIGQIISWFLSLGEVVTTIIDAIFGTDWTSGLQDLQDTVLEWGKSEDAITISREAPTVDSIAEQLGLDIPERIAYGDAYDAGAEVGAGIEASLESFGSSIKDTIAGFSVGDLLDGFGNLLGGNSSLLSPTDPALALGGAYDPSAINDDILKGLEKIGEDTGDIKDSMDLRDDDLDFLRKIADMEWRKEFTTAEIKIDMTNNNTVNGERDLDGIVDYLSDVLRAEMTAVAYGDHL